MLNLSEGSLGNIVVGYGAVFDTLCFERQTFLKWYLITTPPLDRLPVFDNGSSALPPFHSGATTLHVDDQTR